MREPFIPKVRDPPVVSAVRGQHEQTNARVAVMEEDKIVLRSKLAVDQRIEHRFRDDAERAADDEQ